ncbi:MAG TPA: hypothetical protein QF764_03285 [Planctomycetota bacterium]|nr:hypothetical protein [Planctomycetota bacterium]
MIALALLQLLALEGGTVHTMVPGDEPRPATLLVSDGRIEAVGPELSVPEGALRIDVRGRHLVPGLIDGMVHHDLAHDPLYVLAGVTCVRDMGNDLGSIFTARSAPVRDRGPGPDLVICGAAFDGPRPSTTESVVVSGAADVEDKLPRLHELGIDFVAIQHGLPPEAWRRLLSLAHERGLSVCGPLPRGVSLEDAVAMGQDGLCTMEAFPPTRGAWGEMDAEVMEGRVATLKGSALVITPLLWAYAQRAQDPGQDPPALRRLAPHYEDWWMAELEARRPLLDEPGRTRSAALLERQLELVNSLWGAGVGLLPGSAAPNPWVAPGDGLHDELALLVRAGLPPATVLELATSGAASRLGLARERGTLQVGRIADVLVLDGDPREGLACLRRPEQVVLRGVLLEAGDLQRMSSGLLERQDAARARALRPIEVGAPTTPKGGLILLAGRVETVALGRTVSAERYAVVDMGDGLLAYCTRAQTREGDARTTLTQRIRAGRLEGFELAIERGTDTITIDGILVSGQLRIQRRFNGTHLDVTAISEHLGLFDVGSIATALVLGQREALGELRVLTLEDIEPALVRWVHERDADGVHLVRTGVGGLLCTFGPAGGVEHLERTQGSGTVRTLGGAVETFGGPGLPARAR